MEISILTRYLFIILCISLGSVNASIINGSFETEDYTGWTLLEDSGEASAGTWGIAEDGDVINPGDFTFDFHDGVLVQQSSVGLPKAYVSTDGDFVAYQLQDQEENHRMYQDITLDASVTTLHWDMAYENHACEGEGSEGECLGEGEAEFDTEEQSLSVNVRDPDDDSILDTLFLTETGDPTAVLNMTAYSADISDYAGMDIRLDIMMLVHFFYFDAAFDNFRVDGDTSPDIPPVPVPAAFWLFGTALIGFIGMSRRRKVA